MVQLKAKCCHPHVSILWDSWLQFTEWSTELSFESLSSYFGIRVKRIWIIPTQGLFKYMIWSWSQGVTHFFLKGQVINTLGFALNTFLLQLSNPVAMWKQPVAMSSEIPCIKRMSSLWAVVCWPGSKCVNPNLSIVMCWGGNCESHLIRYFLSKLRYSKPL